MQEFDALIQSLGEHVVTYIGRDRLERLDVFGDESDQTASVELYLANDSWPAMSAAIDKMVEIRAMFMDELSIDYRFRQLDSETSQAAVARHSVYTMA